MIPIAGDAVTGGKYAAKTTKGIEKLADATKDAEKAGDAEKTGNAVLGGEYPRMVQTREGVIDTASPELHAQVDRVVDSLAETGRPPAGVRQGGLRGHPPGTYGNRSGALPKQTDPHYYTESDVWPNAGRRDSERIVRGKHGEVWYSPDHYGTFRRIR
ncbi:MAG: ribonuclease domain-containing protein [Patulibacter sp.]